MNRWTPTLVAVFALALPGCQHGSGPPAFDDTAWVDLTCPKYVKWLDTASRAVVSGFNDDGGDPSVTDQQLRRDAAAAIHRRCDHVKNSGYQPWLDVVSDVEYKYGVNQGSGP